MARKACRCGPAIPYISPPIAIIHSSRCTIFGYVEVAVFLLTGLVFYRYATRDKRRDHLPPHVRGWPIINQTFAHLEDDPTGHVIGWAKKYGEIFCTTSATTTFIWLNPREAFKELID